MYRLLALFLFSVSAQAADYSANIDKEFAATLDAIYEDCSDVPNVGKRMKCYKKLRHTEKYRVKMRGTPEYVHKKYGNYARADLLSRREELYILSEKARPGDYGADRGEVTQRLYLNEVAIINDMLKAMKDKEPVTATSITEGGESSES